MANRRKRDGDDSAKPAAESSSALHEAKETTESIVIAFILAFVFRAFIVEAFVIPTGSMAATLYGQHGTLICDDCGWENAYGLNGDDDRAGRHGPDARVVCQNCGHLNTNLRFHDTVRAGNRRLLAGNAESGDRILVFKWPLDFGGSILGPQRWDVTVFKNPANGDENFIKRLVGLPGEVLEIIDGDVYTAPVSSLSEETREALDAMRHLRYRMRTGLASYDDMEWDDLREASASALEELADQLTIERKTPAAQESLWVVAYHHDYPPRSVDRGQPFWYSHEPDGLPWQTDERRLRFDGASGGTSTVRYAGKPLVDHNAYNIDVPPTLWNPVSDLRLDAVVYAGRGEGWVEMDLCKPDACFAARIDGTGRVSLTRHHPSSRSGGGKKLGETLVASFSEGQPIEMSLEVVDYRAAVTIHRREVLATTAEQFSPDVRALRERDPEASREPRITASGIDVELRHVVLFRDVYYTAPIRRGSRASVVGGRGRATVNNPILLRADEYFMLGDNSPASKDSRLWDEVGAHLRDRKEQFQLGTVPADQLVGRAFFVYWPSGLRPDWLPGRGEYFVEYFVPNVGRMRWIR